MFFELSGGGHFFGSDINPSVLFIRKCYDDLLDPIFDEKTRNLRITGNPGVGKTFFGYYLLYQLALLDKTTIYDNHNKLHIILFDQKKGYYLDRIIHSFEISKYLNNPDVYRIVDGKISIKSVAKTILICSPLKDNHKEFDKFDKPYIRYMPVWSWEEINTCRSKIYEELSIDHVRELYIKWGGIPRYVLENALNLEIQVQLQEAIDTCSEKIFKYIGGAESKKDVSHKLVHIWTNIPDEDIVSKADDLTERDEDEAEVDVPTESKRKPYTKKMILFASDFVGSQVTRKLKTSILNKLHTDLEETLSSGKSNQFLGTCFEQMAHQKFRNGGIFEVRSLEPADDQNDHTQNIEGQDEILTFSTIEEIENGKYYQPESKIFPSIDAICAPDKLFQMTTAIRHPIKLIGLEKIRSKLARSGKISFYFVVPSQLYDIYKKQNFATINDTIAKRAPKWIVNRIKQYVLKLDLSSGGLPRMSSTASIDEGILNLSTGEDPSTISTSSSIPAKRSLGKSSKRRKRGRY